MATLAEMRARVRKLIDDTDSNPLNADADVDDALKTAQFEVAQLVVGTGSNLFDTEVTKTSSSTGAIDLSVEKPLKVSYVQFVIGTQRLQVQPARKTDWVAKLLTPMSMVVGYVARPAFPATSGDSFLWGATSAEMPTFDKLMAVIAANELWANANERPHAALEMREQKLREAAVESINIPSWTVMPLISSTRYPTGRYAGFQWTSLTRDSVQLVYE